MLSSGILHDSTIKASFATLQNSNYPLKMKTVSIKLYLIFVAIVFERTMAKYLLLELDRSEGAGMF